MLDAAERRLVAHCDTLMEDALALTRDLVQGYSVLGKEQDALDTMEAWFARLGLSSERIALDAPGFADNPHRAPVSWSSDERYNLVVRLEPETDGPHLVLNGHLDVVPAEPVDMWTRPPWEPWERDGWLYGRGAGDMKAGIAAMVMAVQAVRDCDGEIGAPLTLQTVIEEECSGNGALACLHQGFGGDFALIPEPFGARLYTGQVGVLWFRLRVDGEPAHVLDPEAGSSAIQRLLDYLPTFEELERAINSEPRPPAYADMASPFHLSLGTIQSGNWPSSIPAHAEVEGRIGFPPGVAPQTIMERVRHAIRQRHAELDDGPPPRVRFPGFRSEGHLVDMDDSAMDLLSRCHEDLTGTPPPHYLSTCTTDLRAFHVAGGINGTCYGPEAERIHGVDECVEIDSIRRVMTTYALFIHRWARQA